MRAAGPAFALLILGTAGCGERSAAPPLVEGRSGPSTGAPRAIESPAAAPVASLAGEWRVAGIDGRSFDETYGIALSGNGQELWWEPRCAGIARSYRIEGTAISFGPITPAGAPSAPDSPPPPVCAIAVPARLADVTRALDAATRIARTPENGVLLSGGGNSVTLFSQ